LSKLLLDPDVESGAGFGRQARITYEWLRERVKGGHFETVAPRRPESSAAPG
jgi:hypothetical protein